MENLPQFDALLNRLVHRYTALPKIELPHGELEKCGNAIGITRGNGDSLMVVLGGEVSYASFRPASPEEGEWHGLGDLAAQGTFVFFMDGHWTELPRRHAMDSATALDIARRFLQMPSGLPPEIAWEKCGDQAPSGE